MHEEFFFFLLPERRIFPCLCLSQLHSFGSSSAYDGVLAGIIRDLHGVAASVRTSYFFRAFSTNLTSSSHHPSMFELRQFSVQCSLFLAVTLPFVWSNIWPKILMPGRCQWLVHLSPDKKYPLGEVVFIMVNWVNAVYGPGSSRSASTS